MKKNLLTILSRYGKVLTGVVAILLLIVWSTGALKEKTPPGVTAHQPGFALPAGAPTFTVKREPISSRISVAGTVTSEEKIHISARVGGVVESVLVSAGDRVSAGQTLLNIDDRELREQLTAAEAQLTRAESEFQRTRQLFGAQAATQQQMTDAESAFQSAQAQVEQLRVALTYHDIRSPIDGVVTDRRIEQGDLASPGQIMLALYNPDAMRLDAPVPVRLIDRIQKGSRMPVELDQLETPLEGEVTEIVSEIDASSRTRMVRVRLATEALDILPGTFGRLVIDAAPRRGFRVPAASVFRVGQLEMAQRVQGDRVLRVMVRTGAAEGDMVEILSGLADGDVILTQPVLD
jgi:RND family efflux transporter MFP subunit